MGRAHARSVAVSRAEGARRTRYVYLQTGERPKMGTFSTFSSPFTCSIQAGRSALGKDTDKTISLLLFCRIYHGREIECGDKERSGMPAKRRCGSE